ncbi:hypothetical protein ACLK2I_14215 [Escherichia coli]
MPLVFAIAMQLNLSPVMHDPVQWLIDQGVLFDTHIQPNGEESYHLTGEGGHSHRRILHAADATGREVETTLVGRRRTIRIFACWSAATRLI